MNAFVSGGYSTSTCSPAALGAIEEIGDHGVAVARELVVGTLGPEAPRPKIVTDGEPDDRDPVGDLSLHDVQ
jgi:hypothetical protein